MSRVCDPPKERGEHVPHTTRPLKSIQAQRAPTFPRLPLTAHTALITHIFWAIEMQIASLAHFLDLVRLVRTFLQRNQPGRKDGRCLLAPPADRMRTATKLVKVTQKVTFIPN
jgi:hypothetical protein